MTRDENCIAIIGMGCIFPGANGLDEYWQLLFSEKDAITEIPDKTHFALKDYFDEDPKCPDHIYCRRGGFIPAVSFDPSRYGIPPNNLSATDTSQLLGILVAQMALEDAGYDIKNDFSIKNRTNIILGVTGTQELVIPLGARLGYPLWKDALKDAGISENKSREIIQRIHSRYPEWQENSFPGLLGNVVAGRIANKLDLKGTNSVVDAACASSLSAINNAIMELIQGRCDMSITGGVDALNDIFMHMCFSKTGVLSHTSDARPFSKDSDGTVLGEGVGMIVLKRLKDARENRDRIYAVIRGIGTSSDGNSGGIYAPDAAGQQRALEDAYKNASVDPCTVQSIEAHGTGTRVGDKIEFQALKNFMKDSMDKKSSNTMGKHGRCSLGSVKSMIGHTKAAAGVAGIIKASLSLYHKTHFPTLKAEPPDPELDIANSTFYLNTSLKPWVNQPGTGTDNYPRRAGVSAFGFGGSNFHAVLEEYTGTKEHVSWNKSIQIAAFSAETISDLKTDLSIFMNKVAHDHNLDSREKRGKLAWLSFNSRKAFSARHACRLVIVIPHYKESVTLLKKAMEIISEQPEPDSRPPEGKGIFFNTGPADKKNKTGFLFPGQGSQYTMMGRDIVSIFPEAMDAVTLADQCFNPEQDYMIKPLHDYIFPFPDHIQPLEVSELELRNTDIAQPALGAISLAMVKVLKRFNIKPDYTCGHSFGELTALNAAGRINDTDFLNLSRVRGKYMAEASKQSGDSGSMFAVKAPMEKIEALIRDNDLDLVLANKNSHQQGVLSGSTHEIDRAVKIFKKNRVRGIKLPVAAAFHSRLVENAAKPFKKELEQITFKKSSIEVMSNTSGTFYPSDNEKAREILGNQLVNPVEFIKNIELMHKSGVSTFIEVGPKTVLTGLVKSILKDHNITCLAMDTSLGPAGKTPGPGSGLQDLAMVIASLASEGFDVDLTQWESPCTRIEDRKMNIFLTGANPKTAHDKTTIPSMDDEKLPEKSRINKINHKDDKREPMSKKNNPDSPVTTSDSMANGAMTLIRKGFESMQKLQSQTAKTHEKFLETQAEASRTLQSMMEQTKIFANNVIKSPLNTTNPIPMEPDQSVTPAEPVETVEPAEPMESVTDTPGPAMEKTEQTGTTEKTEKMVFEIISKLTGFPVEMLEPDMDIESDLGIDSIKRVEIISELEKNLPSLTALTPENMSSLKTLKEICNTIDTNSNKIDTALETIEEPKDPARSETRPAAVQSQTSSLKVLIATISKLTGFPEEMLEGDMNLESDLGIDSIKRVEILSTLEKELPGTEQLSSDEISGFKTIDEIGAYLDTVLGKALDNPPDRPSDPVKTEDQALDNAAEFKKLARQIPFLEKHPIDKIKFYNGSRISISKEKKVYLTEDAAGIAKSFKDEFIKQGINADLIDSSQDQIPKLRDAAGIVIIPDILETDNSEKSMDFLKYSFNLIKENAPYLTEAASRKSAFFATVSFLGGGFGFDGETISNPVHGGLAGLSKTAGLEWKNILCKAIDLPCSVQKCIESREDAVTLMMTHGSVETGICNKICNIPKLKPEDIDLLSRPDLGTDDLFIISGGAKGVTAECAIEIAKSFSPGIILLGRSENPTKEPEWIKGISSSREIKKAILENQFKGLSPKPVDLENAYKKLMSQREIRTNIQRIKNAGKPGITVEYFSCDITDSDGIVRLFDIIRGKHGKITGIIHGAGILEDKLIIEKSLDKFCNVFDTKVAGLHSLIRAGQNDKLKFFIAFSSIAARTGNVGQSDYSMANEVINKTLLKLSRENRDCRYLAINWGPWDGGMVDTSLKKEFKKRGIELIDKKAGACQLIAEMGAKVHNGRELVEVIIGADLFGQDEKADLKLTRAFTITLDALSAPMTNSHVINHRNVLPFAIHMELLAHGAEKNNPGLKFTGIDQMRLLKGISFTDNFVDISVKTKKCRKTESGFEAEAACFSRQGDGDNGFLNSAGIVLMDNTLPDPPVISTSSSLDLKPFPMSVEKVYESILFHGSDLYAIKSIIGWSEKGIEITAANAPLPEKWIKNHPARNWLFDPMLLDAAFQAAILWTHQNKKQVCLPSFMANFRLYSSFEKFSGDVTIRFTVNETGKHKIRGYFTFLDSNNTILASITGFEAINHASLKEKFKKDSKNEEPCQKAIISRKKILAFAQGNPSEAFGDRYKIFDNEHEMARLPRPPYFFMDRVTAIDHPQWEMVRGGWVEAQFDVPRDAWYFNADHSDTMPFCILLEIALQPCGWLAAWAGSALQSSKRLYFRNLGGKAMISKDIPRDIGTIQMRCRMTDVSKAGGMIIQDFDIEVLKNTEVIYKGTTNFGFFTKQALSKQVGIQQNKFHNYECDKSLLDRSKEIVFEKKAPLTPLDENLDKGQGMPAASLLMLDKIEQFSLDGGLYGKGYIKGIKQVNPREWFFDAHFYQDPVCPGSLGIESFIQLLRFYGLQRWQDNIKDRFTCTHMPGTTHQWKYRGQIIPSNKKIEVTAHIKDIIESGRPCIVADGALAVDGTCIYEMRDFAIVPGEKNLGNTLEKSSSRIEVSRDSL